MAQFLKDDIRERILAAALDEFHAKGYKQATMRGIAAAARIPAGLIYSYYKSKEDLFDAVLQPVLYDWEQVLSADGDAGEARADVKIHGLSPAETECLLSLFDHRKEFIVLMDGSGGTRYKDEKDRFVRDIEAHLLKHRRDEAADEVFIHIVASNFVDGLMQVMYHYKGKEWAIAVLHRLSQMYLSGIGL